MSKVAVLSGPERRRRWTTAEKRRMVEDGVRMRKLGRNRDQLNEAAAKAFSEVSTAKPLSHAIRAPFLTGWNT